MIMKIFSVYDSASEVFGRPVFAKTRGEFLRDFIQAVGDPSTQLHAYPGDFTAFELGEYCDSTGTLTSHPTPISLGLALEYVSRATQRQPAAPAQRDAGPVPSTSDTTA